MANTRVEEVKEILCCNVAIAILQTIFTRYSSFSLTSCRTWKVQTPENRNPTGADCPCQAMVRETQGLEMKPPSPVNGGASYRERPTSLSMLRAGWFAGGALAGIVVTLMASGAPPTFPGSHRRALQGQEQQLQTSPRCVLESLLGVTPEMESNYKHRVRHSQEECFAHGARATLSNAWWQVGATGCLRSYAVDHGRAWNAADGGVWHRKVLEI